MNKEQLTAVEYLLQQINTNTAFTDKQWESICELALAMERSQLILAEIKATDNVYKIQRK